MRERPLDVSARTFLASLLLRNGDPVAATAVLRDAAKVAPSSPEPHRQLAAIYRAAAYLDHERSALQAVLQRDPHDWKSALSLSNLYRNLTWLKDAEAALRLAVAVAPNQREVVVARATLHFYRNRIREMERIAREGLARWRDDSALTFMHSEAMRLQENHTAAERLCLKAISLTQDEKEQAKYYNSLAHLLLYDRWKPRRYPEAERAARAALERDSANPESHYWLGRALELQGKTEQAAGHYAETAKWDVGFESVAFHLGRIYLRSNDPEKQQEGRRLVSMYKAAEQNYRALSHAREALRNYPGKADTHRRMAEWYIKMKEFPSAIMELRRTLEINSGDRKARQLLRHSLEASGRVTEAKQYARG